MQRCSIANFTKDTKRVANFTSSVARMQREGFLATEKVEIFPCSRAFNCLRSTLKRCNLGVGACLRILLQPTTYYVRSNLHSVLLSVHTHNETLDTTFLLSYKYHKGLLNIRLSLPALYKSVIIVPPGNVCP